MALLAGLTKPKTFGMSDQTNYMSVAQGRPLKPGAARAEQCVDGTFAGRDVEGT